MKIVHSRAWTLKPTKYTRPFVSLEDYNELKKKYNEKVKLLRELKREKK